MLEPKDNKRIMERLFPEIYSLVKGHWYEHIASGSVALYTGNFPDDLTFGINPSGIGGKRLSKNWMLSFYSSWYGRTAKLGHNWINVSMDHVIDMFKQHLADKRGLNIGVSIHYNKHDYVVTDDWYFDGDRLIAVCISDVGSNTHLMLLNSDGINECIVVL